MKREIEAEYYLRLLNNGPLCILGSSGVGGYNACTVAWTAPASKTPPSAAFFLSPAHLSWEYIAAAGEFTVNIPSKDLIRHATYLGGVSGRVQSDKLAVCGLECVQAKLVHAPVFPECLAHLECRVIAMHEDTHLVLAEVVYAIVEEELFCDHWRLEKGLYPLQHLGGEYYQSGCEKLVQPRLKKWTNH